MFVPFVRLVMSIRAFMLFMRLRIWLMQRFLSVWRRCGGRLRPGVFTAVSKMVDGNVL